MRKILCVIYAAVMTIGLVACGIVPKAPAELVNTEAQDGTGATMDASAELPFVGNWYEPVAQRGYCTITFEDGVYKFLISWHDSASTTYIWRFSGFPDEAEIINYTDCVKELHSWNEKDEELVELIEENGCGSVWLTEENRMVWLEHLNEQELSEFVRE